MKHFYTKIKNSIISLQILVFAMLSNPTNAYAIFGGANKDEKTSIENSKMVTGTEQLIEDATVWGLGISTAIASLFLIYYLVRRKGADDNEIQKWNNKIKTTIACTIGVYSVSSVIAILNYYYGS